MKRIRWVVAIMVVALSVVPALADGDFCVVAGGGGVGTKITSLPYTISAPGFYYLAGNLNSSNSNGIMIQSDNVTLDLMGFCLTLKGNAGKGISGAGSNVEIRNGTLMNWEENGINLNVGSPEIGNRIVNVRVLGVSPYGIKLLGGETNGLCHLVKGCAVSGASTGIWFSNGTISGNTVSNCVTGISPTQGNIIGNNESNCVTGISLTQGNIIGNNVYCDIGKTGIKITGGKSDWILVDQNTVNGNGTHFTGTGNIKYGHNAYVGAP